MVPFLRFLIPISAAKRQFLPFAVLFSVLLSSLNVMAQTAPNILYNPSSQVLTVGTTMTTMTPTNSGGAMPGTPYAQVTTVVPNLLALTPINYPSGMAIDAAGNIYVTGDADNKIWKVTPSGVLIAFAGSGTAGETNGTGTSASFTQPMGIVIDPTGKYLYVADAAGATIRQIVIGTGTTAGAVTTYAGKANTTGSTNSTLTASRFSNPQGLAIDAAGNLYVADYGNSAVRKITTTGVTTLASGFQEVTGVAVDPTNTYVYAVDYGAGVITKIVISSGAMTTLAGSPGIAGFGNADGTGAAAQFEYPNSVAVDPYGNVLVTDQNNNLIRFITPAGVVTTIAGNGTEAELDGTATAAEFYAPTSIAVDGKGNCYIGDYINGGSLITPDESLRKMSLTGYTISPNLPTGLSFNSATGAISGKPTAAFPLTNFTVTAYNGYGVSTTTVTLYCGENWTGATSTAWATATNWSAGVVPTAANGYVAQIGVAAYTGAKSQPTVSASTTVSQIIFGTNNTPILTINSGQTLTTTSGVVVNASAIPVIKGPGTISIGGSSSIAATGSLTASLNTVISLAGNSTLNNAGTFILASDANGSSSIAAIPSGSSITGNVTVQRYITGGAGYRGYRLLSSPVYASTVSSNNVYSINYLLNSTFLTGTSFATTATSKAGNPSLYLYRENMTPLYSTFTNSNYRGIGNISASPSYTIDVDGPGYNIPVGNGYLYFFRGDKSTVNPYVSTTVPVASTLSTTGTLNQGTINVKDWFTPSVSALSYTAASPAAIKGFNLLGNPYPGTINFEKFNRNGANSSIYGSGSWGTISTIYFFNPVSKQFCSYQQNTNTISSIADTTSTIKPGNAISSDTYASNLIASGQGFFIQATATGQTFSFRETAKTSTQSAAATLGKFLSVIKDAPQQSDPQLRLRLIKDSVNTDDVVLSLNNQDSTTYSFNKDALDLGGNGALESLSLLSSDSVKLSIYRTRLPAKTAEIIPILADATTTGIYQLKKIELDNLPTLYDVWLKDAFMKDSLDIKANDTYNFNVDKTNPATYGSNRFSLVIRQNPAYRYRLLNFIGTKVPGAVRQVELAWATENAAYCTNFTVERSTNGGKTFDVVGVVEGENGIETYNLLDKSPVIGQNLYRLKQVDINNTITYSSTILIEYSSLNNDLSKNAVSVYPNPVSSTINLSISPKSPAAAVYEIKLINTSGILLKDVTSPELTWSDNVSNLLPGIYIIQVTNSKDKSFVGETKFIKL